MPFSHVFSYTPLHRPKDRDHNWRYDFSREMERLCNDIRLIHAEMSTNTLENGDLTHIISKLLPENLHNVDKLADIRAIGRSLNGYFITDESLLVRPIKDSDKRTFELCNLLNKAIEMRLAFERNPIQGSEKDAQYNAIIEKLELKDQQYQALEKEKKARLEQEHLYENVIRDLKAACVKLKTYLENRRIKNNTLFHKKVKPHQILDDINDVEHTETNRSPTYDLLLYNSLCELELALNGTENSYQRIKNFESILTLHRNLFEKNYDTMLARGLKGVVFSLSIIPLILGAAGEDDEQPTSLIQVYRSLYKQRGTFFLQKADNALGKVVPVESTTVHLNNT